MKFFATAAIAGFIVWLLLDIYVSLVMLRRTTKSSTPKKVLWHSVSGIAVISLLFAFLLSRDTDEKTWINTTSMWLIFLFISLLISTFILVTFDILSYIPRLWKKSRYKCMTITGIALSLALFVTMWWGAAINRNRISVTHIEVNNPGWPATFDGYKIAHISDLHSGTWGADTTFMSRLVERVNSLSPNMIVFTGDIVSSLSKEFTPFVATFGKLNAPDGVCAVLGNHDYGDYHHWATEKEHINDRLNLIRLYHKTGTNLLLNESVTVTHGNDSIVILGVENIGEPPFKIYGSLTKAYPTLDDNVAKILLSHNPTHWTDSIANDASKNILLTLSGHTHAMQIQIGDFTPASWKYTTPWGRYDDTLGRTLYVNRGAGTVGMPMRIGATPEITLITLRK